jgi:thiol-disulfide isomerase/thioredoxin
MKKILSVLFMIVFLVGMLGVAACTPKQPVATVEYKVSVVVEDGTVVSGADVRFYSKNKLQAEAKTDANGVAKAQLKAGDYVVSVRNFSSSFELDTTKTYTVSATETELTVTLTIKSTDISYKINVQSFAGTPLTGIGVNIYKDNVLLKSATTVNGTVTFVLPSAIYDVKLSDIPLGYYEDVPGATYKTDYNGNLDLGGETAIKLKTKLIEEEAPAGHVYSLGSVMHDFSIRLPDGSMFVLSEALDQYKAVYVNFWATWCGPCMGEFPHIQKAYEQYSDDVYFLAISTTDSNSTCAATKSDRGWTFAMCADNGITSHFDLSAGIPQTYVIDRYAVIADYHFGSYADVYEVTASFEKFSSDDYEPDPVLPPEEGGGDEEVELIKPTFVFNPTSLTVFPKNSATSVIVSRLTSNQAFLTFSSQVFLKSKSVNSSRV